MSDLPTREEAQRIVQRLAEGPTTAVQESDIEDVAMSARCLVAVADGRLVDRETIDAVDDEVLWNVLVRYGIHMNFAACRSLLNHLLDAALGEEG